ncbi:hypothetical protein [Actinomadura rudentiformis]|uniref:Uncharacterized protein n=1 Tax=Actinomadura rudentiformis TaxID=359158 RepID=A0A6H9YSS6_9ACTN|nr:hypothetical protein [Actinomadura rudentiformis]KAB2346385.1 hypothetical protein F8566_23215 [Actinomadura rudentiformis]
MADDLLSNGPERPRRPLARRAAVAAAVLLVIGAGGVRLLAADDTKTPRRPVESAPAGTSPTSGIVVPAGPDARLEPGEIPGIALGNASNGSTLERRDRAGAANPWSVVVRRKDGSLASHGAVITYPVPKASPQRRVRIGGVQGRAGDGQIIWKIAGSYARIRGDLPERDLVRLAAATTVVDSRPSVRALAGFPWTVDGHYRPRVIREARYGSKELAEVAALGRGLTLVGVAPLGGVEDRLYEANARPAGTVRGKPAVVTSALGGNGILAWEATPGMVAFVGYSGASMNDDAVAALRRVAERTRLLDEQQWRSTGPHTTDGVNDFG